MTQADLFRWLLESTCTSSAAIVLVLLLRRPLRAGFGANAAYLLWSLLPLAVLVALLPAPAVHVPLSGMAVDALVPDAALGLPATSEALVPWLLAMWCAGVAVSALSQVAAQRRFHRSLGPLRDEGGGLLRAGTSAGLPAVVGLQGRIVLPADFDLRYSADERALILAHERIHRARGDVAGNALVAGLRCLYWFNPLFWIAADRFRRDQELACDETVVARHPHARRVYGEAMVKTQLSAMPAPLACHWFGGHPLKERIAMLKHPSPGTRRIALGLVLAGFVIAGTAYATWAARPADRVVDDTGVAAQASPRSQVQPVAAHAGTPADSAARVEIQSRVTTPPKYPADAAASKTTGKVVLIIDVAADGSVADARVEKSEPAGVFDQATLEAVQRWKFEPATENGKPVAGRIRVPVTFEMDKPASAPAGGDA
jgi:TonB family protein